MKKIIYIDLDNTLADYLGMANVLHINPNDAKHIPGFFRNLKPIKNAINSYNLLNKYFEVYILSTGPWSNPLSLVEKVEWVKEYLPDAYKNIIFSHHKNLNIGDYLIDDSTKTAQQNLQASISRFIQINSLIGTQLSNIFLKKRI